MDVSEIKGRVLPETIKLNNNVAAGDLLITDKVLADEIRNGKRDLSPGYYADIIEESGTFNDETRGESMLEYLRIGQLEIAGS